MFRALGSNKKSIKNHCDMFFVRRKRKKIPADKNIEINDFVRRKIMFCDINMDNAPSFFHKLINRFAT